MVFSSDVYHSVRVYDPNETTLSILHNEGIPLDHVRIKKGIYIDVVASDEQTNRLIELGILHDILIADMTQHFLDSNVPEVRRDFELGSMLGNYTHDEVLEKMDTLAIQYPTLVSTKDSIGTTVEGRTIWSYKVSDNPNTDEEEPKVPKELFKMENAVLLPHLGSASLETREAMGFRVVENVRAFFNGKRPRDRVA